MTRLAVLFTVAAANVYSEPVDVLFKQFIEKFAKTYRDDPKDAEGKKRKAIFEENVRFIETENKNMTNTYTLGISPFADMTHEEFQTYIRGGGQHKKSSDSENFRLKLSVKEIRNTKVPKSVDWRESAVTSVKNQGTCESSWAFSAVGALEGAYKISSGKLVDLSVQNLLDCDRVDRHAMGCVGGDWDWGFEYVCDLGLASARSYPYECVDSHSFECTKSTCQMPNLEIAPDTLQGYIEVESSKEALELAVAIKPVSVAIDADSRAIQLYQSGILPAAECGHRINHAVLAVGYGEENGQEYWLVKNQWTMNWGEEGYIRLAKSGDHIPEFGTCGIFLKASYPIFEPYTAQSVTEKEDLNRETAILM